MSETGDIVITEAGPQKFELTVRFGGRVFDCGVYLSRASAQQAGRLFLSRKAAEVIGAGKNPRKKR